MFVNGIIKHRRIILKNVLRAVAMMNIKIHYTYSLYLPFPSQISGGNSYIVEIAKSHNTVYFSMMSWRTDSAKGIVYLSLHHEIDGIENSPYSKHRGFKGLTAYLIIRMIKLIHPQITRFFKAHYKFNAVHNLNPLLARASGLYESHFGDKTRLFKPPVNREQSCRTLRMFGS